MDFTQIGLTKRDKRIYEALVHNPEASVRKIAETTAVNRGSVFESLKSLLAAGLIARVQYGQRTAYRAKDPEVLHEIIAERQRVLADADASLGSYIASFAGAANSPELFHFASLYKGDEGLAAILRDVLKTCRRGQLTGYRAISSPRVSHYLYNNFPHFTHERVRLGLSVRVVRQGQQITEQADCAESRYLGAVPRDSGCYTLIYGTKVAIITINDYNQTSGVIIDNEHFADVQCQLFDAMWDILQAI
jgi:sugar-specific transcriptional regulator TrmB